MTEAYNSAAVFARVRSLSTWVDYMVPCWGALGGLDASAESIRRDLSEAINSPETHVRQVRLELTLAALRSARDSLDEMELGVSQALEEARR